VLVDAVEMGTTTRPRFPEITAQTAKEVIRGPGAVKLFAPGYGVDFLKNVCMAGTVCP